MIEGAGVIGTGVNLYIGKAHSGEIAELKRQVKTDLTLEEIIESAFQNLTKDVNKIANEIKKMKADISVLKSAFETGIFFNIPGFSFDIRNARRLIEKASKLLENGTVKQDFLYFFNITIPSDGICRLDIMQDFTCSISSEYRKIYLNLRVKLDYYYPDVKFPRADPFLLFDLNKTQICKETLSGLRSMVVNKKSNDNCTKDERLKESNNVILTPSPSKSTVEQTSPATWIISDCVPIFE